MNPTNMNLKGPKPREMPLDKIAAELLELTDANGLIMGHSLSSNRWWACPVWECASFDALNLQAAKQALLWADEDGAEVTVATAYEPEETR